MYGKFVEGLSKKGDKFGYLNKNKIRLGTTFAFSIGLYSFVSVLFFAEYFLPVIFIGLLWIDFIIKVLISPKYSIFGNLAGLFVKTFEPISARERKFAWTIGLVLSSIAFLCVLITSGLLAHFEIGVQIYEEALNSPKPDFLAVPITPPIIACVLCMVMMASESIFGYCIGCKIQNKWFNK